MTDLEMNGACRCAAEVFNLCRKLDQSDVLNVECIRVFNEYTIDGQSWTNNLETSQNSSQMMDSSATTHAPPTRKPNARTDWSRVNEFGACGYRPLVYPLRLLSACEFLQQ